MGGGVGVGVGGDLVVTAGVWGGEDEVGVGGDLVVTAGVWGGEDEVGERLCLSLLAEWKVWN